MTDCNKNVGTPQFYRIQGLMTISGGIKETSDKPAPAAVMDQCLIQFPPPPMGSSDTAHLWARYFTCLIIS